MAYRDALAAVARRPPDGSGAVNRSSSPDRSTAGVI